MTHATASSPVISHLISRPDLTLRRTHSGAPQAREASVFLGSVGPGRGRLEGGPHYHYFLLRHSIHWWVLCALLALMLMRYITQFIMGILANMFAFQGKHRCCMNCGNCVIYWNDTTSENSHYTRWPCPGVNITIRIHSVSLYPERWWKK